MERTFAAPTAWCLCGSLTNFPHIILPYANLFNRINSLNVGSHKICGNAKLIVSNKMRVDTASPEKTITARLVFWSARPDQKQTLLPINSFYTCKDCGLARENSDQKECDKVYQRECASVSATVACPFPELFSNLSRFDRLLGSGPVNQNMYRNCEIPPAEVIGRSVLCIILRIADSAKIT